MNEYGDENLIARTLESLGLYTVIDGGWVYVKLPDGRWLLIAADDDGSLSSEIYTALPQRLTAGKAST